MPQRCAVCGEFTSYEVEATAQLNNGLEHPLCGRHLREWLDFVDVLVVLARLGGHTVTTTRSAA